MSHGGTTGSLFGPEALGRPRREIAPGAFWVPDWLSVRQQAWIVHAARELGRGPVPYHSAKIGNGQMSVSTLSLGWHWYPYGYSRFALDVNGRRVADIPEWLVRLGQRAIEDVTGSREEGHAHTIDAALLNFYDTSARMGMHIDGEESSDAPIISLSIGDTCTFRFGNTETRTKPYTDVALASGDLFVFGGPSRRAYHGVPKIAPGTAPEGCGLSTGRLNVTLRVTGMVDDSSPIANSARPNHYSEGTT